MKEHLEASANQKISHGKAISTYFRHEANQQKVPKVAQANPFAPILSRDIFRPVLISAEHFSDLASMVTSTVSFFLTMQLTASFQSFNHQIPEKRKGWAGLGLQAHTGTINETAYSPFLSCMAPHLAFAFAFAFAFPLHSLCILFAVHFTLCIASPKFQYSLAAPSEEESVTSECP